MKLLLTEEVQTTLQQSYSSLRQVFFRQYYVISWACVTVLFIFLKKSVNGCFSSLLILKNQPQFRITSFMAQTNLNSDHYLLFLFRDILKCHPWLTSNCLNQHYNSYIKYILWLILSLILTDFVLQNVNRTKKPLCMIN